RFGVKSGDEVRVVSMGTALHGDKAGRTYSLELCGGTHVRSTGDIGLVRLLGDSAVAAGVRRIEALTGEDARRHLDEQDRRLKAAAAALKVAPADVVSRIESVLEERRRLERELSDARKKLALGGGAHAGARFGNCCRGRLRRPGGRRWFGQGTEAARRRGQEGGRIRRRGLRRDG